MQPSAGMQSAAISRNESCVDYQEPISNPLSGQAALRELLGGSSDYLDQKATSNLAPFCLDAISWPDSAVAAPLASTLVGDDDRNLLQDWETQRLLCEQDEVDTLNEESPLQPFVDAKLKGSKREQKASMKEMHARN